ncbi:hypothetical protein ER57_06935 [Smithella sp. SCADC]|jgi:hypothetical protein|nr:hypothetical protein ER57_06935 [Smithella sp. SCADC]
MGGLPRLKKKDELHYRKGQTNEAHTCQWCRNFCRNIDVKGIGGVDLGKQCRCTVIGLQPSRRYRIYSDHTCDAQEYKAPAWIVNGGNHAKKK